MCSPERHTATQAPSPHLGGAKSQAHAHPLQLGRPATGRCRGVGAPPPTARLVSQIALAGISEGCYKMTRTLRRMYLG